MIPILDDNKRNALFLAVRAWSPTEPGDEEADIALAQALVLSGLTDPAEGWSFNSMTPGVVRVTDEGRTRTYVIDSHEELVMMVL